MTIRPSLPAGRVPKAIMVPKELIYGLKSIIHDLKSVIFIGRISRFRLDGGLFFHLSSYISMKVDKASLAEKIFQSVKDRILSGEIECGELITEEKLSLDYGTSRSPVREAMQMLREYGLIDIIPRSHASVINFTTKEIADFNDLRYCLECHAIDLITPERLEKCHKDLEKSIRECEGVLDRENRALSFEYDATFHITLIKAAENDALVDAYNHIEAKIQMLRIKQYIGPENLKYYVSQHRVMFNLLKQEKKEECKDILLHHIIH